MRQIFCLTKFFVGFGGGETSFLDLSGTGNSVLMEPTGGFHWIPMPLAGTFRNLALLSEVTHPEATVTFQVDGVDTDLAAVLPVASTEVSNTTDEVAVSQGDMVVLKVTNVPAAAYDLAFSIEFEGAQQWYGSSTYGGMSHTEVVYAGCLGNGVFVGIINAAGDTHTYSIVATPGTITGMRIAVVLNSKPGPGTGSTFIGHLMLNGVIQDGAGGTIDTTIQIADAEEAAQVSFTLPVTVGQHVQFRLELDGATVFPHPGVAMSVAFTPTDGLSFMLCGGSSLVVGTSIWNQAVTANTDIDRALSIVGNRGLTAVGFYGEIADTLGDPTVYNYTLLKNEANTALTIAIQDPNDAALVEGDVAFASGDTIAIASPDESNGQFHWGLAAQPGEGSVTPTTTRHAIRRLRRVPIPNEEMLRLFIDEVQLYCQTGVGLSTGQGSAPVVMFRWSTDGGATWSNERQLSVGAMGEYRTRVRTLRLGSGRDWVLEFTQTDPVFTAWLDLFVLGKKGTS